MYANNLVTTRRALENNTSHNQVLELGAFTISQIFGLFVVEGTHGSSEPMSPFPLLMHLFSCFNQAALISSHSYVTLSSPFPFAEEETMGARPHWPISGSIGKEGGMHYEEPAGKY
eukprot:1143625-Pelagomonas_calceolata.AAC.5